MAAPSPKPYKAVHSEFAEGAWRGSGMWTVEDADGETVAVVTGGEERKENARLFAVSPDLLVVAQWLVQYAENENLEGMLEAANLAGGILATLGGEEEGS